MLRANAEVLSYLTACYQTVCSRSEDVKTQTNIWQSHLSVHRKYISKVQPTRCNVFSIYLFLEIALHVSGGSSAHNQEHKTVHTASGIVQPILLLADIVDEMELTWCGVGGIRQYDNI
jgi:hypothetical protein